MKPEPYPHPIYSNVTLWDLPGIGTSKFPADQYLKRYGFENLDFFIIVSAGRFRENDAKLAQEIKKMGKKFYFVRSKIDNNLRDAERSQREYDEEKTLQKIRENCIQGLEKQGDSSPQVFLVSNFELSFYDFPALQETMERELPSHKRDVLILALPNVSISAINKKKEVFRSQIKWYASLSAAVAAVPIPGLSIAADLGILVGVITRYLFGFGLDKKSLEKISRATNIPYDDLRAVLKSPCSGKEVTKELVKSMLRSLTVVMACEAAEEGSRWIPLLGIPIAASLSFTAIYTFLRSTLDGLSVDAENVLKKGSKVLEDIKKAIENNDIVSAASITNKHLEDTNNIPLNIAITGESGSGKSTFINAFRGIDNTDERAARTGVATTTKPEPYPHPIYHNVTLWDLPGIGTSKFPADQYLKRSGFENVDFFIIVSAGRFRENDAKLAQEIKKMGKYFYYVRSKIDNNLRDAERSQREYDEEKTLQKIRENCIQGLEEQGVASPQVFLVSNFDLHLYDFPALHEIMERELPSHKRDVLILALPNICKSTSNKKKEVFSSQIKYYALMSAAVSAVPIPGLSIAADSGILVGVLRSYLLRFGLDQKSLEKLSSDRNIHVDDLRAVMKSHFSGKEVTKELVKSMLRSLTVVIVCEAAEEGFRWIPLLGIPIVAAISFTSVYKFLSSTLDSLSVDAENVLIKALNNK
ncbi:unnamed protein product [Lota lota]